MNRDCDYYKGLLIDVLYDEDILDEETRKHLDSCEDCRVYFDELQGLNVSLENIDHEIPIDYMNIKQAFNKAEDIQKKNNLISLSFFIVISSIILASMIALAFQGYARQIIYFHITMYFILPISLIGIIKVRANKEGYNEK